MITKSSIKKHVIFYLFLSYRKHPKHFFFLNESFFFRLKVCCRLIIMSSRKIDSFLKKKSVNTGNADAVNNVILTLLIRI